MKKFFWIAGFFSLALIFMACSDVRRNPGRVYMPDMGYSRAYETYAKPDSSKFTNNIADLGEGKIFYNATPVTGAIARGDEMPFPYAMDKPGDSANYNASKQVQNPEPTLTAVQMKESERLYLVNCGICHGTKLDGNGPLYKDGTGPFSAAPKNLVADPVVSKMPDGQMFYSITYGKNAMGSYASQITTRQRWMIIHYIKSKQAEKTAAAAPAKTDSTGTKTKTDSTAVKK